MKFVVLMRTLEMALVFCVLQPFLLVGAQFKPLEESLFFHRFKSSFRPQVWRLLFQSSERLEETGEREAVFHGEGGVSESFLPDWDCANWPWNDTSSGWQLDWNLWRLSMKKNMRNWSTISDPFLDQLQTADQYKAIVECPIGMMTASLINAVVCWKEEWLITGKEGAEQAHMDPTSCYGPYVERFQEIAVAFNISFRVLVGSEWPIFQLLYFKHFKIPTNGFFDNPEVDCEVPGFPYSLDWSGFREMARNRSNEKWAYHARQYYTSEPFQAANYDFTGESRRQLEEECRLGLAAAAIVKTTMCAGTESICFEFHSSEIDKLLFSPLSPPHYIGASRWPIPNMLYHIQWNLRRHPFWLDFTRAELAAGVAEPGRSSLAGSDAVKVGRMLEEMDLPSKAGNKLVFMSMIYGPKYNKYLKNFAARAAVVGIPSLVLFCLDEEAFELCMAFNGRRCVRGTPSIVNKFTLPLMMLHLGFDVFWIDLDVFIFKDPSSFLQGPGWHSSFEILVSDSFTTECICSGVILFRSSKNVRHFLLALVEWLYAHPYEHDQKLVSAFLGAGEVVAPPRALPVGRAIGKIPIPKWGFLDSRNLFVTSRHVGDTGWTGDPREIYIFHFLHGESDAAEAVKLNSTRGSDIVYVNLMEQFYEHAPPVLFSEPSLFVHEASLALNRSLYLSYRLPEEWTPDRPKCRGVVPLEELE